MIPSIRIPSHAGCAAALALACSAAARQVPFGPDGGKDGPITLPRLRGIAAAQQSPEASSAMRAVLPDGSVERFPGGKAPPPPREIAVASSEGLARLMSPGSAVLVLSDGQRIVGALDVDRGTIAWVSQWLAPMPVDLERVRAIVLPGGTEIVATDEDVVDLRNGDRVTGAVVSVLPDKVTVERVADGGTVRAEIEMKDVLSVSFVGTDAERSGIRAWLADGTVIDAPEAAWIGGNHLQFPGLAGAKLPVATVPRRMVAALQSSPDAAMPLATLPMRASAPEDIPVERRREDVPTPRPQAGTWALDAPTLEIEGPATVRFAGIDRPSRLMMLVRRPTAARAAGTPDLVIRSGGREVLRERLEPDRASIEIRQEIGSGPFEIELTTPDGSIAGCFASLEQALLFPANAGG